MVLEIEFLKVHLHGAILVYDSRIQLAYIISTMYLHDKIWIRFVVYDCCGRAHFTRTNILAREGNVTIDAICRNQKVNKAKMDARKLLASYISLAILRRRNKKKKRKRAIWSRSWLKRSDRGVYRQLLEELRLEDPELSSILANGHTDIWGILQNIMFIQTYKHTYI
jgi:hypothetical protein